MFKSHIRDLFYNHFGCLSPYENTLKYWRMAIGRTLERENTERERSRAEEAERKCAELQDVIDGMKAKAEP